MELLVSVLEPFVTYFLTSKYWYYPSLKGVGWGTQEWFCARHICPSNSQKWGIRPGHRGAVLSNANLASLKVNIGFVSGFTTLVPSMPKRGSARHADNCPGQDRSGLSKGQYLVVLNFDFLFSARICCCSFSGFTPLIPRIPERGRVAHADTVAGKTDPTGLIVNIVLFSIGTPCFSLETIFTHFLASSYCLNQLVRGAVQGTEAPFWES